MGLSVAANLKCPVRRAPAFRMISLLHEAPLSCRASEFRPGRSTRECHVHKCDFEAPKKSSRKRGHMEPMGSQQSAMTDMYVCRKMNSQARTGHQRGMGGRGTDDDDTHERHTDTNKLTTAFAYFPTGKETEPTFICRPLLAAPRRG